MRHESREYLLMIVGGTLTMLAGGLVMPIFAPFVRKEFTAPIYLVGIAVSGYFIIRMLAEFPIGTLSDRVGQRKPLIIGRLLGIIGAFVCYTTNDIWTLILARALWGVGDASFFCVGMTYVSSLFPQEKRGRALGVFQAVELTGFFLGQTVGGFIGSTYGLRSNFLIGTAIGVVTLAIVLLIRGQPIIMSAGSLQSLLPSRETLKSLTNRVLLATCFINMVCMLLNSGLMMTLFPIYVTEQISFTLASYGILLSSSTAGNIAGNLAGGVLSDRLGRRSTLNISIIIGTIAILGLSVFTGWEMMLILMFMTGFFGGVAYGVTPAFIADSVPAASRGMAIGTFRTFFDFGGVVGPIIYSWIFSVFGYVGSFYFGAASLAINWLFILQLKEKRS